LKAQLDAGAISQREYNLVEQEAQRVKALYRDAISDQIEKIEALKNAKLADLSVEQAGIRLAIEVQKGAMASARARGDEYGAIQAGNEIKRLEIQMSQLVAKAKQAEAEAGRMLAQAKIEEIRASGPMTAAKEAEIRALEAAVKVKEIEAKIAGVTADSLRDLTEATYGAGNAAGESAGGYDKRAGSMNNAADASDRLNASRREGGIEGSSSNGNGTAGSAKSILDDPAVKGRVAPADVEAMMYKRNPQATVDEIKAAAKYYGELYARGAATRLTGNLGNGDNAARLTNQVSNDAMDKALELARKELSTGQAIDLGTPVDDLIKKNLATTNWANQTTKSGGEDAMRDAYKNAGNVAAAQTQKAMTTVNINLNGQRNQITTDAQGAAALSGIFKKLESDAARSF